MNLLGNPRSSSIPNLPKLVVCLLLRHWESYKTLLLSPEPHTWQAGSRSWALALGTKLQIPPFSYYSWPADLLLAFTVQQVAQTTPARALSRTLPRTVVKTWAQSNAWTEPREMQCTASAACVSEWVDVTKSANGTKSCYPEPLL